MALRSAQLLKPPKRWPAMQIFPPRSALTGAADEETMKPDARAPQRGLVAPFMGIAGTDLVRIALFRFLFLVEQSLKLVE